MFVLLSEVFGQIRMARFEQRVVQGEGAILAVVKRIRQLDDRRGPMVGNGVGAEGIADDVAEERRLILMLGTLTSVGSFLKLGHRPFRSSLTSNSVSRRLSRLVTVSVTARVAKS